MTAAEERLELIASKAFARMSYTEAVEVSLLSDLHFLWAPVLELVLVLAFWLGGEAKFSAVLRCIGGG